MRTQRHRPAGRGGSAQHARRITVQCPGAGAARVLGHDVAGVVISAGSAVRDFQVGDEVYARRRDLRIGTFAEYIAIDQGDVAPQASLAHPARGGRGAAGVTGRLAGPR
jgi:NADPH:quinone reductase-like Zn-dependent oxidoreductase